MSALQFGYERMTPALDAFEGVDVGFGRGLGVGVLPTSGTGLGAVDVGEPAGGVLTEAGEEVVLDGAVGVDDAVCDGAVVGPTATG